jgi:hypothetical protein
LAINFVNQAPPGIELMLTPYEIELATGREPVRVPCYYCGGVFCTGGCGPQVEAELHEERRQRQHDENLDALDALAAEKRELELVRKLRDEHSAQVEAELEQKRAEYEANCLLLDKARAAELSGALQRAGTALENE